MNNETFEKRVLLTLAPYDKGPVCSYSPICSPSSRSLSAWRMATITMTETALAVAPEEERAAIGQWITQLVYRELGADLAAAEEAEKTTLQVGIDDLAARLIGTALAIRVQREQGKL